jgi:2-oxoglutarate ferredoxin oxidoreductase subunit beta
LIIFINNGIYGMTGGQMAPTTLAGIKTTTSPFGRDTQDMGYPLKITELIAQLPGVYYCARVAVNSPVHVRRAKKAIYNGFKYQELNKGLSFVEIVTNCPSNWKMTPVESNQWMEDHMLPFYQLGDLKVPEKENLNLN